jgi:hypothetical protein
MFNLGASELVIIVLVASVCGFIALAGLILLAIAFTRKRNEG